MKGENEIRSFSVYEADSSLEAARKMVQNLRMDDKFIMYWAAFIQEKRLQLELPCFENDSPGPSHHTLG